MSGAAIERLDVATFRVPTEKPESDGTLEWDSTTVVVVEATAGGVRGLGYTYGSRAAATVVEDELTTVVVGCDANDPQESWRRMMRRVRNVGRPGVASHAIAAVDIALWDVHARLRGIPLATLLGAVRDAVPVYGSGGFTSASVDELQAQLAAWVNEGITRVKMKVGRDSSADRERVHAAREAIGPDSELFVDANGAYGRELALAQAHAFAAERVTWFEEPVSSDDLEGLRLVRAGAPAGLEIAAGEYGYDAVYFRRMLEGHAIDVAQLDATRCAGITGFLEAAEVCYGFGIPISAHTAPALHVHICCGIRDVRHVEWFYDHIRVESLLFDGVTTPERGMLAPDFERPGLGLELRREDAAAFSV